MQDGICEEGNGYDPAGSEAGGLGAVEGQDAVQDKGGCEEHGEHIGCGR